MNKQKPDWTTKYTVDPDTGCWIYGCGKLSSKYPYVWVDGRCIGAHVLFYTKYKGNVPDGLEIDHLCRNTQCVNPDHLEAVTHRENMKRGGLYKLTRADVDVIRSTPRYIGVVPDLAKRFGVSRSYIKNLRYKASGTWLD